MPFHFVATGPYPRKTADSLRTAAVSRCTIRDIAVASIRAPLKRIKPR
jgi:hypothetical protein